MPSRPDATYRPHIDGLRGLAVTAVLLFHAGFMTFRGGFVGVDIFFVISGYLITSNIVAEARAGTFTFSGFYVRRARRLFPALFVTLATTLLCGTLVLSPQHARMLAKSVVFALASISNVLFWTEAGYFDVTSHVKPLLHTWSLSVEEQFYLVWPCVVVGLLRLKRAWLLWLVIALGGALSLYAAERWVTVDEAAAFYLAPFRVFELAIGACCIPLERYRPTSNALLELLVAAGLSVTVGSILIYAPHVNPSGMKLLAPCLGAALLLYAGSAQRLGMLLRNPVAVSIGRISYSLYLTHWPLIVLYGYARTTELRPIDRVGLIAGAVALALPLHRYVEQRFRAKPGDSFRLSPGAFGARCLGLAAVLGLIAASTTTGVWRNAWINLRYPQEVVQIIDEDKRVQRQRDWESAIRSGECYIAAEGGTFESYLKHSATCLRLRSDVPNILVLGDSHAADLWVALRIAYPNVNFLQATGPECTPIDGIWAATHACGRLLAFVKHALRAPRGIQGVLLSARWRQDFLTGLEAEVEAYQRRHIPVVIVGPTAEFHPDVSTLVSRLGRLDGLPEHAYRSQSADRRSVNAHMRVLAESLHAPYVDRIDLLCDNRRRRCTLLDARQQPLIWDYGHWTAAGHAFAAQRLLARFPTIESMFK